MFVGWAEGLDGLAQVDCLLADSRLAVYGTLASIFGSLLGFTITATSVVLGFSSSKRLRVVRESCHYSTLWKVFLSTIRTLGCATVMSLSALVLDRDAMPRPWVFYLVLLAFLVCCLRIVRVVWVLEAVVRLLTKRRSDTRA